MFNLENAIQIWIRQLRSSPAFEDGDITELESHLREEIERLKAGGLSEEEAFKQASEEIGEPEPIGNELYKSRATQKAGPIPPWRQPVWMPSMISNYLKVARRNLFQNKLYSGINILGLSVGIISCLLIYLFVRNELNYDKFHEKGDRIYRVVRIMDSENDPRKVGITSAPFRDALINDFPDMVDEAVRLMPGDALVTVGDEKFLEKRFFIADANFFQVFSWPLVHGDPDNALKRPNTMVLSEATALKYFGNENPIGQTIKVDRDSEFEVTGVFGKPVNGHSHIEFDMLASMETFRNANFYSGWWWNTLHTYVMLPSGKDPHRLESQLSGFMEKYFGENMVQNNRRIALELQPLEKIYFANDTTFDWRVRHGSKAVLYLFGIIALLIIGVACVNFVNMATARSVRRAREIGIRKTLGAGRFNLLVQYLGESLMITFTAGLIAFALLYSLLPWFEQLIGVEITVDLFSVDLMVATVIFLVLTGLGAGAYPAFLLSSFKPVKALKEKINFGTSQLLVRKGLIVFQFAITSILIIGTLVVNSQLNYISDKSLGFQPDQLLNITINNNDIFSRLETFQNELNRLPGVEASSAMSGTPGGYFDNQRFRIEGRENETHVMKTLFTDFDFTEVLDLEMLAGRDFDPSYLTDSTRTIVINRKAAEKFGWTPEEALGKRMENQFMDSTYREVIGVVENFHFESLHQPVAPLVVAMNPDRREILVKMDTGSLKQTMASIERVWNKFSPLFPIESFFLDQQFAQLYESDRRQRSVFTAFSIIAVIIACLGLFSLAAFNAEQRTKEMGIRKVLGAGFKELLMHFNREILAVVTAAFLFAVPAAYLMAEQWLQGYAFRISNGWMIYLAAGAIVLALSVLTVSYQSIKIARMNPVKSLRSE